MLYNVTNREGSTTVSVFTESGEVKVLPSTAATFGRLLEYLTTNNEHDEDEVLRLIDPALFIGSEIAAVTGDRVTYDKRTVLLDGEPLKGLLAQHLADKIEQGDDDWKRFAKFLVKLDANPSRRAREETFKFLERTGLTITEDGNFIAYKGVLESGLSATAGDSTAVITDTEGNYLSTVKGQNQRIPNQIGTIINVARRDVDDNHAVDCSYGLHVGSYGYASTFSERLLTVEVNPADVVTVPTYDASKMRVCSYKVIALSDGHIKSTSYDVRVDDETDSVEDDLETYREIPTLDEEEIGSDFDDDDLTDSWERKVWTPYADPWANLFEAEQANDRNVLDVLLDTSVGHKPAARALAGFVHTTESSVRRWRKAHGVSLG